MSGEVGRVCFAPRRLSFSTASPQNRSSHGRPTDSKGVTDGCCASGPFRNRQALRRESIITPQSVEKHAQDPKTLFRSSIGLQPDAEPQRGSPRAARDEGAKRPIPRVQKSKGISRPQGMFKTGRCRRPCDARRRLRLCNSPEYFK